VLAPLGDTLSASAGVVLANGQPDALPSTPNTAALQRRDTCEVDTSSKRAEPRGCGASGYVPQSQIFTYRVRFQNTTGATLASLALRDVLDENLDLSTFELAGTSHPPSSVLLQEHGLLIVDFPSINLPPSSSGDAASRGFVVYRISAKPGLAEGKAITNSAGVYFGMNTPLISPATLNTVTNHALPPGGVPAAEACNGADDDCDGAVDDNASPPGPTSALGVFVDKITIGWSLMGGATSYDVVKGNLAALHTSGGNFATSLLGCPENDSVDTQATDPAAPAAGNGFYYLVRTFGCGQTGTYDSGAASQVGSRDAEIAASPNRCP
jgi:hypothetical protein